MQHHAHVVTALDNVPVTRQHRVPEDLEIKGLANPGLPRANITCDVDHPQGTYTPPPNLSVLQQHVAFWDRDGDGIIWPGDTYVGFRRLGFNALVSALAVPIVNGTFSWWSTSSWLPDPLFRI